MSSLQITDTFDTSADFHVLIGIIVNGQPFARKADLTGLSLQQNYFIGIFNDPLIVLDPYLIAASYSHNGGPKHNILREL